MNLIKIAKTCLVSLALAFGLNAADKAPPAESVAGKYSAIRNRIAEAKHAGRKVVLVLGAVPSERDHFQFNEASGFDREPYVVYLNDMALDWATYYPKAPHYAHNPVEAPAEWHDHFIQANFNYPQGFSGFFLNSFDLIISDYGTDHFMDFFKGHLKHFLSMLTDTGKMEFRYDDNRRNIVDSHSYKFEDIPFSENLVHSRYCNKVTFSADTPRRMIDTDRNFPVYKDYPGYISTWSDTYLAPIDGRLRQVEGGISSIVGYSSLPHLELSRVPRSRREVADRRGAAAAHDMRLVNQPAVAAASSSSSSERVASSMDSGPRAARAVVVAAAASSPERVAGIDEITINGITCSRSSEKGKQLAAEVRMHLNGYIQRYKMGHYLHSDFGGIAANTEENIDKLIAFFSPKES